MIKNKLSVIIPARGGTYYLQQTINELFKKAKEDIEIIVVFDGLWPNPLLKDDPRLLLIHHGTIFDNVGMKEGINRGIAVSKGEYLMKSDGHCMFDEGFDVKLKADCEENWVVIPRRYRLNGDDWKIEEYKVENEEFVPERNARPPVDYMYLAYPYERPFDKTCGLHGAEWREKYYERKDIAIDDTMSWQGSAYFMTRKHWDKTIKYLDTDLYGGFTMEAQEIGNKTWLSGGRLVINKKTWYAHMHKGKRGKQYSFSNEQYKRFMMANEKGRLAGIDYWINNKWTERKYDFEWLLEKFWPIPTWPENWREQLVIDEKTDYRYSEGYQGL